jgi:hypothetical protein
MNHTHDDDEEEEDDNDVFYSIILQHECYKNVTKIIFHTNQSKRH